MIKEMSMTIMSFLKFERFQLILWVAILLLLPLKALGQDIVIEDIRIEGLQRVSASSVFAELPVRVGDRVDDRAIANVIRKLFATGFFSNVQIAELDSVLIIRVLERAAISSIELDGNKALKTEDLLKSLNENGLSEGQIFKPATLEGMQNALLREYVSQGHYAAVIKTDLEQLPRNRVSITINVDEGKKTSIKRIHIVGNKHYSDKVLLGEFESKTTDWLSWFNSKDKYSREKMSGDLESLESFYLDKGYLQFSIDSTQISISPDKKSIYVTVKCL